jgi:tetratricopeptide (TPR) repeat protein
LILLAAIPTPFGVPPLQAQNTEASEKDVADSLSHVLENARDAQRDFENLRRQNLPRNTSWNRGECDATVGRMCWRYNSTLDWSPRPESPRVTEARSLLLNELEEAARRAPGNEWILGQRVRYLVEAGLLDEARTLAWECREAGAWWCRALEGFVLHLQGRFADAERLFDQALQAMDPEQAARWQNLDVLLDGPTRDLLRQAAEVDPAARSLLVERIWQLADPLYILPGNDRRTEHLARRTAAELFSDAAIPHRLSWGPDLEELHIRYGWELGWEQAPPRPGELGVRSSVVGFENPDVRRFLPPREVLLDPGARREEVWSPSMERYSRSGYAPGYAPVFLPMASRLLVFTRGDRALVAATYRLPADTTYRTRVGLRQAHSVPPALEGWPLRAGLLLDEMGDSIRHASMVDAMPDGVLLLQVPAASYQASVEVLDPATGIAGRYRNGLEILAVPPDLPVLSDVLLVEGDSLPGGTVEALGRLRLENRLDEGEALTVGWELWGLGWEEMMVGYRLTLEPASPGLLERFRRLFGGQSRFPILEWEEPGPREPGPHFQSVTVTPPGLEPGEYRLRLEVRLPGRTVMVSEIMLDIVEPEAGEAGEGG